MKQLRSLTALLLTACMFLTACGGTSSMTNSDASRAESESAAAERAVSEIAVSGSAITETTVPAMMEVKTPYEYNAIFTIKESNSHEYKADVVVRTETEDADMPGVHWELYLDMADEIKEISGASIVSHEGTHYIIRGETPHYSSDDGLDEDMIEFKASFGITVAYHDKIQEPRVCFFSKEMVATLHKKFDCSFVDLKKEGDTVTGKIRLANRSGKKIPGWELEVDTNFEITSLDGNYTMWRLEYYTDEDEGARRICRICSEKGNLDLEAGETKEIPFTGVCHEDKPKKTDDFELYRQCEAMDYNTWNVLEYVYGGSYGKMDEYLVADTVFGMDVFFVFDEKKKDRYTATAELTNVIYFGYAGSENEYEDGEERTIADWEIYLECEDTIESITGAEIVSHEGNVYHIRAKDSDEWLYPFSFTTFQVEVSCPEGIHPLGKTYLVRAKVKDSDGTEKEQEFAMNETAYKKAASVRWMPYYDLYDPWFDTDYFEDDEVGEYEGFMERQEWGKKMGRMSE